MAFIPRAPKPLAQREFVDVQFVAGQEWTWQIPDRFTTSEISRIRQVPFAHAHRWLVSEMNKPLPKTDENGRMPSSVVSKEVQDAQMILSSLNKEKRVIPSDADIERVYGRFDSNIGVNEWSDEVCKEQLDIICLPKNGAPKLSSVFEQADKELMRDAINFFFEWLNGETKKKPEQPEKDSGQSDKSSEPATPEKST